MSSIVFPANAKSGKEMKELKDLICQMLRKDAKERIKMHEIKKHPFMI